jgi:hypothetical protein
MRKNYPSDISREQFEQIRELLESARKVLCQRNTVKYAWIQEQSVDCCVTLLCAVLSVTRSAYYAWAKAVQTPKAKQDAELKSVITATFTKNRAVYGTRRLKKVLEKQGYMASRRRIGRIMQEAQLRCKNPFKIFVVTKQKKPD